MGGTPDIHSLHETRRTGQTKTKIPSHTKGSGLRLMRMESYAKVRADVKGSGVSKKTGASCRQCSETILSQPGFEVPECWLCAAEHRYAKSFGHRWLIQWRGHGYGSHSIIRCFGYDKTGNVIDSLHFDYFTYPDSDNPLTEKQVDDFNRTWPDSPEIEYLRGMGIDQVCSYSY